MTTNANAPVETRHEKRADQLLWKISNKEAAVEIAQLAANLEAANNRLAEIDKLISVARFNDHVATSARALEYLAVNDRPIGGEQFPNAASCYDLADCLKRSDDAIKTVATRASGHTPSPCPGCAAKDEAMGAFKADLSAHALGCVNGAHGASLRDYWGRFIILPADPLTDTVREIVEGIWQNGTPSRDDLIRKVSAELKSRLPLGGAK